MRISFQLKLMLIMTAIVIASTWTVLSSMSRELQKAYREVHEQRFLTQVDNYLGFQRNRLSSVAEWSEAAVNAEATLDALRDPAKVSDLQFLRNVIEEVGSPAPGRMGDNRLGRTNGAEDPNRIASQIATQILTRGGMAVYLVNAEGKILEGTRGKDQEEHRKRLRHFKEIAESQQFSGQDFGVYLTGETSAEGIAQVFEVVATPVFDPSDQELLGGLLVGLPLAVEDGRFWRAPEEGAEASGILAGLFVEGEVISSTIPTSAASDLKSQIDAELENNPKGIIHIPLTIDGVQHDAHLTALNPNSTLPPAYHVAIYPLTQLNASITALQRRTALFGCMVLAVALSMAWFVSRRMTIPIRQLVGGTKAIAGGKFDTVVPVRTHDEIGELAASFNVMAVELAMKEKYRSILDKVTDKAVAHELMRGEVELGGELRQITVLFSDIRGFTSLTEGMPPSDVIELLNEHMSAMTDVVHECNGVVDKFVGDLVMAVFGAPKSYGNDALNAVRCAERMMQERDRLNAETGREISIGIGIASGEVLAGCMGSHDRLNYTVLGDRVNLASRLCHEAKPHEVLLDKATSQLVKGEAETQAVDSVMLRGFSQPVPVERLVRVVKSKGSDDAEGGWMGRTELAGA